MQFNEKSYLFPINTVLNKSLFYVLLYLIAFLYLYIVVDGNAIKVGVCTLDKIDSRYILYIFCQWEAYQSNPVLRPVMWIRTRIPNPDPEV